MNIEADNNYNLDVNHDNSNHQSYSTLVGEKCEIDEDNECSICCNEIEADDKAILKCNHFFHYDCILTIFKNDNSKYYKGKKNVCPYCRSPNGYLPLKIGVIPLKYIHKEYSDYINNNDIKKYLVKGVCCAILKSGKNVGNQCKKPLSSNNNSYCNRHEKYCLIKFPN